MDDALSKKARKFMRIINKELHNNEIKIGNCEKEIYEIKKQIIELRKIGDILAQSTCDYMNSKNRIKTLIEDNKKLFES